MKKTLIILSIALLAGCSNISQFAAVGSDRYCQPDKAMMRGMNGQPYTGECAGASNEAEVVQSWQKAYKRYEFRKHSTLGN